MFVKERNRSINFPEKEKKKKKQKLNPYSGFGNNNRAY